MNIHSKNSLPPIPQAKLEGAANFLEDLANLVPNVVYIFNIETMSNEYSNRSIASATGFSNEEISEMGKDMLPALLHPDDQQRMAQNIERLSNLADGASNTFEYRVRAPSGGYRWFLSIDRVYRRNADGMVSACIGVATDITKLKDAQDALRSSNEELEARVDERTTAILTRNIQLDRANQLLDTVVQTVTSAIVGLDRDGRVLTVNDAARHILGGINEEPPFEWPSDIRFLDRESMKPLEMSMSPIQRALAGQTLQNETNLLERRGNVINRYVNVSSASVANTDSPINTVVILEDVSEQELARQRIERSSRLDALGQLTGGIAHDFNNLLAAIQYSVALAVQQIDKEEPRNLLTTALGAVERGANLSRRLLAFAKRQPGMAQSKLLSLVGADFMELIRPTIESTINITFTQDEEDIYIFCDIGQLENAMLNLVLNARDAIMRSGMGDTIKISARGVANISRDASVVLPKGGSTFVSPYDAERDKDAKLADHFSHRYIEIAVTDNGPGMSDEVKRRAIDPFFSTKESSLGTGLGLSMVYGFAQQSNGELRLYSEVGQGSTVRLILPRGTQDGAREARIKLGDVQKGMGQTILVVEDEPMLLEMLTQTLEMLNYQVIGAKDGAKALDLVHEGTQFDLMLTDIVMPGGLSGFELAEQMHELRPDAKIVYMSGYTGYQESEMGGAVAPMLAKPCPELELSEALSREFNA
jgi:PAS domain S-box-containing protein